jgi:hypothetical protein
VRVAHETRAKFARLRRRYSKLEKGKPPGFPFSFATLNFCFFFAALNSVLRALFPGCLAVVAAMVLAARGLVPAMMAAL